MTADNKDPATVDSAEVASIHDIGPPPIEDDYVNPAQNSPRWLLGAHALGLRLMARLGFHLGNRSGIPSISPTETIWLDSTLSKWKGKEVISADVWLPPDHHVESSSPSASTSSSSSSSNENENGNQKRRRPVVINFHGGGFILGQGTDDSRWANVLVHSLGAVVFSVNYRLSPGYPFPTPVEDCADAILQISRLADKYRFDTDRIILSGFSAGGTLAMSSWLVLTDPARWNYEINDPLPKIAGLVLYYPVLDWTLDRPQKRAACAHPDKTLTSGLTDLIDASYLHPAIPRRERTDPRLSPGIMPDDLLDKLPPIHLCLCEYDMLLAEGRLFAERLEKRGKHISVRVLEGEKHAWDKPLPLAPKETVAFEYDIAVAAVKSWFDKLET
ncbi:hypothetical protein NPX13_g9306 [Xylaria arbuscula]|uniref:Alpha/beta hydrolase fold-3 domain-containing protein n=1 Tax=Xylaria arbuscula TaxID=114810 RepID=A0A9W8N6Y5_9PEZI|nr:hypothetical protein NPX13_g9306 [Xylaria arbuscula]